MQAGGYDEELIDFESLSTTEKDVLSCNVCWNVVRKAVRCGECEKYFCEGCIRNWNMEGKNSCPTCRKSMARNFRPDLDVDARLDKEGVKCKKCSWKGRLERWGEHRCSGGRRPETNSSQIDVVGELYSSLSTGHQDALSDDEEAMMNMLLTAGMLTGDDLHHPNGQRRPVHELREILQAVMRRQYGHLAPSMHRPRLGRLVLLFARQRRRPVDPEPSSPREERQNDSLTPEESEILNAVLASGVLTHEDIAAAESQNISRKQLVRRFIQEQQQAFTNATQGHTGASSNSTRPRHVHPLFLLLGHHPPGGYRRSPRAGMQRVGRHADGVDEEELGPLRQTHRLSPHSSNDHGCPVHGTGHPDAHVRENRQSMAGAHPRSLLFFMPNASRDDEEGTENTCRPM